jgi:hypothetical protein
VLAVNLSKELGLTTACSRRRFAPRLMPGVRPCQRVMRPLFSVHAGEYLVGSHIEQHFRRVNLWVPAKDTGIDLLVSDRSNHRSISLQVKFSKDFLVTHRGPEFQRSLKACGWWTLDRDKLK